MAKKFKLNLRSHRISLGKSLIQASKAIKAGPKAIAAARRKGDRAAVARHKKTLANAKRSKKNLTLAIRSVAKSCCDQFLNCDPTYGG
jgi:hypothetical protein